MEDLEGRVVDGAGRDQAGGRDDDAFLEDVGGVGADGAGAEAADVGEMGPAHDEGDAFAAVEDGGEEDLVVAVGDGAMGAVAVVVPVEVARLHGGGRELGQDRGGDVAEDGDVGADGEAAVVVEEGGVEVLLFADEGADGGSFEEGLHLRMGGADGAAEDFEGDGVAGHGGTMQGGGLGGKGGAGFVRAIAVGR